MKAKKILALVFALVLILATALPAHAAEGGEIPDTEDPGTENPGTEDPGTEDPGMEDPGMEDPGMEDPGTEDPGMEDPGMEDPGMEDPGNEIPGEPEPDVINVQVPASGYVTINPYRMEVAASSGVTTDQIIHESQALTSGSDFPVLVSARAVGKLSYESDARFVEVPPAFDAPDKQIFMYVEFQTADNLWSDIYSDAPNQLLVTSWGLEKENVLTLDPFGAGYFRLFGSMTDSPDTMWGAIDAPNVTLAFTFAPVEAAMDAEDMLPPWEPGLGPVEEPVEQPEEEPTEEPVEQPEEEPTEEPVEQPEEEPTEGPVKQPEEEPTEGPTEQPGEEPEADPVEEPVQKPTEEDNG